MRTLGVLFFSVLIALAPVAVFADGAAPAVVLSEIVDVGKPTFSWNNIITGAVAGLGVGMIGFSKANRKGEKFDPSGLVPELVIGLVAGLAAGAMGKEITTVQEAPWFMAVVHFANEMWERFKGAKSSGGVLPPPLPKV